MNPIRCGGTVFFSLLAISVCGGAAPLVTPSFPDVEWRGHRGDPSGVQHVDLAQINAANVHRLQPAWEYKTGEADGRGGSMYTNPLIVEGLMYISTSQLNAVAIDARTGAEVWKFVSSNHNQDNAVIRLRNRGVSYWKGDQGSRIFHFVKDRVYALDAKTGALITSFGKGGHIDLRENLGIDPSRVALEMTSPGAIYKDLLIIGSRVNEDFSASPGHIRAFDTVTGEFRWIFHTIPKPGEFGHDTWGWVPGENYGGANAWGGVTIDEKRGWAFVATGSPTEDYYGGMRKGANLFGNCVLALDAMTGKRIWHYQTTHHDLWDWDNPSAPILVTLRTQAGPKDAVVQLTKMGFTFVLDRETGVPLFPTPEVAVPKSTVMGEETHPTQPIPSKPAPLVRQQLTEADLTTISPESRAFVSDQFKKYISGSLYTPSSVQGTIMTPGWFGGVEWGGGSFDPMTNVLYVNANEAPVISRVRPVFQEGRADSASPVELGRRIYEAICMACHRFDREGAPPVIPSLVDVHSRRTVEELRAVIGQGRNSMPAYDNQLRPPEMAALIDYLKSVPSTEESAVGDMTSGTQRYASAGTRTFVDQDGYPAIAPPWGTLNAINLVSGEILWKVPLGEYPELVNRGIRNTGTLNFGGPVGTAGGIVFIAATADEKIRAFEKHSGRVLWEYQLPAGGYAIPSVYMLDGRQYLVIAAGGGGKNGTKPGDSIVAFALPAEAPARPVASDSASPDDWISLFDGKTLDGWVHMNGWHTYTVEEGAIVGRTSEGSPNSFLCSLDEFGDFELELETTVDKVTNQGIQFRSGARPITTLPPVNMPNAAIFQAGRVYGPQMEVRRFYPGQPTTGTLYGEALGIGWMSSQALIQKGHSHFHDEGWNRIRMVARGPRIQTWVNDHLIEDLVNEDVHQLMPRGFIALQIHGLNGREPGFKENGLKTHVPLVMKWRNIRIRSLAAEVD